MINGAFVSSVTPEMLKQWKENDGDNLAYQPDYDTSVISMGEHRFTFKIDENQRPWIMTVKPEPRTVELDTACGPIFV